MPITPTYPGVYIEELPSAVHTIVGVPTSVAAFVGSAARGPVDTPVHVGSWAEYVRAFGGLQADSPMSYAVYLFFVNGGNSAQIVRAGTTDNSEKAARLALSSDVVLVATSPGTWGDQITVTVNKDGILPPGNNFNLTITDGSTGAQETYRGLGLSGPNSITTALASSAIVNVDPSSKLSSPPAVDTFGVVAPASTAAGTTPGGAAAGGAPAGGAPAGGAPAGGAPAGGAPAGGAPAGGSTATSTPKAPTVLAGSSAGAAGDPTKIAIFGAPGQGIESLVKADIFNMLCLPSATNAAYAASDLSTAAAFCAKHRAMLIVDPPSAWAGTTPVTLDRVINKSPAPIAAGQPGAANAAIYYPNLIVMDPISKATVTQGPCGAIAGVWATTDDARGVWKAPAGTAAGLVGISDLEVHVDDDLSGQLNPVGVNCLRTFPIFGSISWGARTMAGADEVASQWKYIPVRRTALFVEESLRRGTQWVVFEPNDEPLWSSVRLNINAFMNGLFKKGAFAGSTPADAYLVQCDANNNPQSSVNLGILNILVGFRPLEPAEFVIIQIQQLAGQLQG